MRPRLRSLVLRSAGVRGTRFLSLALLLGVAALLAGGAMFVHADNPPNGITVTGQGVASLPPDQAIVNGSVQTQAATASEALSTNSQAMQAVVAAVKAFSARAEVQTTSISIFPQFSFPQPPQPGQVATATPGPPTIIGFQATSTITVKTSELDTLGNLIQTMVDAGLTQFFGVQFTLVDPEQLRLMSLQAAIGDAEQQARAAAAALGVGLGGVLNFTTQFSSAGPVPFATAPPPPAPPPRLAATALAQPPVIQPGPLSATSSVIVTFAILGPVSSEAGGEQ